MNYSHDESIFWICWKCSGWFEVRLLASHNAAKPPQNMREIFFYARKIVFAQPLCIYVVSIRSTAGMSGKIKKKRENQQLWRSQGRNSTVAANRLHSLHFRLPVHFTFECAVYSRRCHCVFDIFIADIKLSDELWAHTTDANGSNIAYFYRLVAASLCRALWMPCEQKCVYASLPKFQSKFHKLWHFAAIKLFNFFRSIEICRARILTIRWNAGTDDGGGSGAFRMKIWTFEKFLILQKFDAKIPRRKSDSNDINIDIDESHCNFCV